MTGQIFAKAWSASVVINILPFKEPERIKWNTQRADLKYKKKGGIFLPNIKAKSVKAKALEITEIHTSKVHQVYQIQM